MKKHKIINIILFTIFIILVGIDAHAATTSKLHFCEYRGTITLMKSLGIFITIAKTIVPIILIYRGVSQLLKVVMNGKDEDMRGAVPKLVKSLIAGLAIFFIPTIINFLIDYTIKNPTDSDITKCTTCLFDSKNCKIPSKDPVVTTRD